MNHEKIKFKCLKLALQQLKISSNAASERAIIEIAQTYFNWVIEKPPVSKNNDKKAILDNLYLSDIEILLSEKYESVTTSLQKSDDMELYFITVSSKGRNFTTSWYAPWDGKQYLKLPFIEQPFLNQEQIRKLLP